MVRVISKYPTRLFSISPGIWIHFSIHVSMHVSVERKHIGNLHPSETCGFAPNSSPYSLAQLSKIVGGQRKPDHSPVEAPIGNMCATDIQQH